MYCVTDGPVPPGGGHIPALDALGANAPLHEPLPMGPPTAAGGPGVPPAPPPASDVDVASLAASIMSQVRPRPQ